MQTQKHYTVVRNLERAAYLVSADDHALDPNSLVDGSCGHECNDGGAVWVGNDGPVPCLQAPNILRINLRDYQRHPLSHPECRAIVHHL